MTFHVIEWIESYFVFSFLLYPFHSFLILFNSYHLSLQFLVFHLHLCPFILFLYPFLSHCLCLYFLFESPLSFFYSNFLLYAPILNVQVFFDPSS